MDRREIYSLTGSIVRIADPNDGGGRLFSVESAADTSAVLRPCDREAKDFAAGLVPGAVLQLTAGTPNGALHGQLRVTRWSPAQRMLIVDNPQLASTQRREAHRVAAAIPVDVLIPCAASPSEPESESAPNTVLTARSVRGTTRDLSQGGCALVLPGEELVRNQLFVCVLHTERQPILVVLEVLGPQSDVRHAYRTRFHQIAPFDQTVLAVELRRLEMAKAIPGRLTGGSP